MCPRPAERLTHRYALQRVPTGIEDQRVPGGGGDRVGIFRDAAAAEERAGIVRRLHDRVLHLFAVRDALALPGVRQPVIQPSIAPDIVILQVDRAELRIAPRQTVPLPVPLEQPELRHPIQLRAERPGIVLESAQDALPPFEYLTVLGGVVLAIDVL